MNPNTQQFKTALSSIRQFIELMNADERQAALKELMQALPPSSVKDAYENFIWKLGQNGETA